MEKINYSEISLDELITLDKVDIKQVIKYFKSDILSLNELFMRCKGHHMEIIIGQWVLLLKHSPIGTIIEHQVKIANYLEYAFDYTPKAINDFIDNIKTQRLQLKAGFNIEINDDFEAYDETGNFKHTLGGSCMHGASDRYYHLQDCLANPKDLQICTVRDAEGVLVARTLIWKEAYFDRIYANSDTIICFVKKALSERGFESVYYYPTQSIEIEVKDYLGNNLTPYLDSVYYYAEDEGILSTNPGYRGMYELQDTDGEGWSNCTTCSCCGNREHINDMYYVERGDDYVCSECESNGDIVYARDTQQHEYTDRCIQASDTGKWFYYKDSCVYTEDTENYFETADDLYCTSDTEEWFENCDRLYCTEDTGNYFVSAYELYYTEDSCNYFEDNDGLYFAEDTKEWYEFSDTLYYNHIKEIYTRGED